MGCGCTPLAEEMSEASLQEVDTYFARRQNTAAQYIATRLIMDLCLVAERRPGKWCLRSSGIMRTWNWRG